MNLAIDELRGKGEGVRKEDVDAFLSKHDFPLVEGPNVTFVFHGAADQVNLRHWISGLPLAQPLRRLDGTDLWYVVETLPRGSRIEYKLELHHNGHRQLVRDPLNPALAFDPFGANSVCQAEGYVRPDWTVFDPEARQGEIQERMVPSAAFQEERPVAFYLPARMREARRYPLLVVHDGWDFLRFAQMKEVLDNLIHRLEIPPMIVALTHSPNRLGEYGANDYHARFIAEDVLGYAEEHYPLRTGREHRCLMGASFGGVATLHAAYRHPGVFGRLMLLSGSFAFTDIGDNERGPAFETVVEFMNDFRQNPGKPTDKLFIACGVYESLIYENRSLIPVLQDTAMEYRYRESRDGHNWENWRDRLREGLSWLFPGPLWMVYE